ncbi:MAG: DUF2147 domain-containing protein [Hyphomicrobiaceae bacterium]|nr:DUF2147 domain-containing protein [Hyphomicrobiaceae bacterium]
MLKMRILSSLGSSAAAAVLVSSIIAGPAAAEQSPLGIWLDDKGRGAVEIAQCGPALCGKVVWVKFSKDKDGCGAKIMDGVKPAGKGSWDYGWIYSPDHGRKFDVALTPEGNDRLRVTGYAGIKIFSESRTWTRAPADLPRCDTAKAATAEPQPGTQAGAVTSTPAAPTREAKDDSTGANRTTSPAASSEPDARSTDASQSTGTPSPSPTDQVTTAQADTGADAGGTDAYANAPRANSPQLGGLSIDKVLKKSADGSCNLDLPWVKIKFACKDL